MRNGLTRFFMPVAAILVVSLLAQSWGRGTKEAAGPGSGVTIRSATSSLPEELFQAEIVNIGLSRLGYKTAPIVQLAYPLLLTALANGDVDIFPVYVEPNHDTFFNSAGGANKLRKVGLIWRGVNGYQIDKRTADRYQITNLQQFHNPEIARLFDSDGTGKADLVGCDPGWSCELAIEHQMDAYHLRDTISVKEGNYAALVAAMLERYREGKPIFFYTWSPFWLGEVLKVGKDVVWLEVPFTSYPESMGPVTAKDTTVGGKNLGHLNGRCRAAGNKKFLDANPAVERFLELVKIPATDIIQESYRIKQGESRPEDFRRHAEEWIRKNDAQFQRWLGDTRSASPSASLTNPAPVSRWRQGVLFALDPFRQYTLHLDSAITVAVNAVVRYLRPVFHIIGVPIDWVLRIVRSALLAVPPIAALVLTCFVMWRIAGPAGGIFSLVALALIGFLGLWEAAMVSCALVVTAVVFCFVTGIPLGVMCARSDRFERLVRPVLDAMQTLPALVYLVPIVMLFGIGEVPGVIATIVYALPPMIRFTNLGIRQVSGEVVEAAYAFGSTPRQVLWEVQIPLALPSILAGINQTVLFALGMTVIASMIAVPGLGLTILQGVNRLDVGAAAVGGLCIVLLAILLDRLTQGIVRVARRNELGD